MLQTAQDTLGYNAEAQVPASKVRANQPAPTVRSLTVISGI